MEVSCQLHAQGNSLLEPIVDEAEWAPVSTWTLWSKENLFSPARKRNPAVEPKLRHCTDRTIPAPFSEHGSEDKYF
jgi:hypothetical protein